MTNISIKVEKLSKNYQYGTISHGTLSKDLQSWWARIRGQEDPNAIINHPHRTGHSGERFWALQDISFEVMQGEIVGIIGRNGAGKSTLLKILSDITSPSKGCIKLKGRVGSLLEVGTGFHPELTGRENIFLNGAILGMNRAEIRHKFDEIVAFAEVEEFIDTPVKRYSSGMYVRLAFAVAAHLEPEILLVDEVLAVGDADFQKKCLGKMGDVANAGRTILFVSHNMTAIRSLCKTAIWLDNGRIIEKGDAEHLVINYTQRGTNELREQRWDVPALAPGNEKVRLHYARLIPLHQETTAPITVETPLQLEFAFWNYLPNAQLNFSVFLENTEGNTIFNVGTSSELFDKGLVYGSFCIPGNFLNDAMYKIKLFLVKDTSIVLYERQNLLSFEVHDAERKGNWYGKWPGAVRPQFDWKVTFKSGVPV